MTTHRQTNAQIGKYALDLIYMESLDRVRVIHSFIGNFISNHRIVGIELEIRKTTREMPVHKTQEL